MSFSVKESEGNDLIEQYPESPKRGQFQNPLFSLTVHPVRMNNPRTPSLGLAEIYTLRSKAYSE